MDAQRVDECGAVVAAVGRWAGRRGDVRAVAIVGSWARGAARMDSDLDLVIITTDPPRYTGDDGWIEPLLGGPAEVVRRQEWGALSERRLRLGSGFEIECGFTGPSWAAVGPVDPGTARVVGDGCIPVFDPDGLLARLIARCHDDGGPGDPRW